MAIAKPKTLAEKAAVERSLRELYPQMSSQEFKNRVAKARGKKAKPTARTKKVTGALKDAGLSDSDLARLR